MVVVTKKSVLVLGALAAAFALRPRLFDGVAHLAERLLDKLSGLPGGLGVKATRAHQALKASMTPRFVQRAAKAAANSTPIAKEPVSAPRADLSAHGYGAAPTA